MLDWYAAIGILGLIRIKSLHEIVHSIYLSMLRGSGAVTNCVSTIYYVNMPIACKHCSIDLIYVNQLIQNIYLELKNESKYKLD